MLRSTIGKARILIVDDEQANVRLLERILELIGATQVQSTVDSREAMALFLDFRPDLVLLDLHMPNVTGFDIMEQIKALCEGENPVPVLVLTADVTTKTKHRALAAGAKDYLTKPLDQSEVLLRIRNLLENRFLHIQLQNQNIVLEEQVRERTAQLEDTLSKLRLAQHTAIKQERLSALGTMAAGIAHDFNNALTLILGYSDLMLTNCKDRPDSPEVAQIKAVTTAARDAAQIVRRLREFHRPDDGAETRVTLQLNSLIEQAVTMTRPRWKDEARSQGREIYVRCQLGELPPVKGDPAELREMLTNLVFNAVDAMPDGGEITVQPISPTTKSNFACRTPAWAWTRKRAAAAWNPFLPPRGNTAQGWAFRRFTELSNVTEEPWKSKANKAKAQVFASASPPPLTRKQRTSRWNRHGNLRESCGFCWLTISRSSLTCSSSNSWKTVTKSRRRVNGPEALATIGEQGCDLLITDQSMPGMTGAELAAAVKEKSPKTAVILLTGFGGSEDDDNDRPPGVDMVLGKPATSVDLRRAIVRVTQ